tara:strand:- start:178 stop:873 length:696 start_codon:yes stop_codon:yes gene_type:complete
MTTKEDEDDAILDELRKWKTNISNLVQKNKWQQWGRGDQQMVIMYKQIPLLLVEESSVGEEEDEEKGLFAARNIPDDTMIGQYIGKSIIPNEAIISANEHLMMDPENPLKILDPFQKAGGWVHYANDALKEKEIDKSTLKTSDTAGANTIAKRIQKNNGKWIVVFITQEDIQRGEEIIVNYGDAFWKHPARQNKLRQYVDGSQIVTRSSLMRMKKDDIVKLIMKLDKKTRV